MSDRPPLVSVVIPVHDGERYLAEALDSVLAQTHPRVEVIVSDDGSADRSAEVARGYGERVRWIGAAPDPATGPGPTPNRGVAHASGSHLAFLDADDRWRSDKLERQLALLAAGAGEIAFCMAAQFTSPELDPETAARYEVPGLLVARQAGGMLISREDFERVGSFGDARMGEFMEWLLRARELGLRELVDPEVMLERRIHPAGHSLAARPQIGEYARILKRGLDRRRAAARLEPGGGAEGGPGGGPG